MLRKVVLSLLSFLIVFFTFASYFPAVAADTNSPATVNWYNSNFLDWYKKVYDENVSPSNEIFGERYTAAQVQWVVYGLGALIINAPGPAATQAILCIIGGDISSCGEPIKTAVDSYTISDASQQKLNQALSLNQMSGVGYIKDKISSFSLIPVAHAQGFGFSAASPIQKLWVAFRNLAFGLSVVVILVLAFMIMFRVKISPQTVITAQSAIPKIIIALILVTFSYAIAGFMIDLLYVVMGLLASFVASSGLSTMNTTELFNALNTSNIFILSLQYILYFVMGIVSVLAGSAGGLPGFLLGILFGYIAFFILTIVLFIGVFKTLWLLVTTYVKILLQIAIAPIQILFGAIIPTGGFGGWLKELAANLAVFPLVGLMYVLAFFFLGTAFTAAFPPIVLPFLHFPFGLNVTTLDAKSAWIPPMTSGVGNTLGFLWLGASVAVITLIPKVADIIKGFMTGKPFAYGTAVGEAIAPVGSAATGAIAAKIARSESISEEPSPLGSALRTMGIIRK